MRRDEPQRRRCRFDPGEFEIRAVGAGAVRSLAVHAALGVGQGMEPVVNQRVDVGAGDDVNRAAVAAVAAARSAARHELLATERQTPASAMSGFDVDVYFVNEQFVSYSSGMTLMTRPRPP